MEQLLKSKRALNSFTQDEIADILGLSRESYRKKECGKIDFKQSEIKKIKDCLKLTNDEVCEIFFTT